MSESLSIEDRPMDLAELVAAKAQLNKDALVAKLLDGRAHVRGNALLGLAALGYGGAEYASFLRDGEARVARAAAEALLHVASTQQANIVAIAEKLDGARPEVAATIAKMFAQLVGTADAELIAALDTSKVAPAQTIIAAAEEVGIRGLRLLEKAARDERTRVRINALRGVAMLGELDQNTSMEVLTDVEREDKVSDVRATARTAIGVLAVRTRNAAASARKSAGPQPPVIPELDSRDLTPDQILKAAAKAPVDELMRALLERRLHVRTNAVKMLGAKGEAAPATARGLAVILRDEDASVRAETAASLGKMGASALVAAPALVAALADPDPAVATAAEAALAALGPAATGALVEGLDTTSDAAGTRVATLIGKLPDGPALLIEALKSTTMEVRLHATIGLGQLGPRAGAAALAALGATSNGGNARLKNALAEAMERLAPRPDRRPPRIGIDGFEERTLTEEQLAQSKPALSAIGAAGVAAHLQDVRPNVRSNAAISLGVLGGDHHPLVAALRDESPAVRLAAAKSLDKLGDEAVVEAGREVARLLADPDAAVAAQASAMLKHRAVDDALARSLESGDQALALIVARPHAADILTDAWARPAAQANAAKGFAMLGKERLGKGRFALEGGRVDANPTTRELARNALRAIDGEPAQPVLPNVKGFDSELLAEVKDKLEPAALAPFLADGRAVVRANAATALAAAGATGYATSIGALLKDDDARVRIAAAKALDKLGDDAVVAAASFLVGALRDGKVVEAVQPVLAARKAKVEDALIAGLDTSDETHGERVAALLAELPNGKELLFIAFDGPAQNVTINAAFGIGMLGAKRAGEPGRRRLQSGLRGPITRTHHACRKALALFG